MSEIHHKLLNQLHSFKETFSKELSIRKPHSPKFFPTSASIFRQFFRWKIVRSPTLSNHVHTKRAREPARPRVRWTPTMAPDVPLQMAAIILRLQGRLTSDKKSHSPNMVGSCVCRPERSWEPLAEAFDWITRLLVLRRFFLPKLRFLYEIKI